MNCNCNPRHGQPCWFQFKSITTNDDVILKYTFDSWRFGGPNNGTLKAIVVGDNGKPLLVDARHITFADPDKSILSHTKRARHEEYPIGSIDPTEGMD